MLLLLLLGLNLRYLLPIKYHICVLAANQYSMVCLLTCPTAVFRGEFGPEFERDDVSCDDVSCESSLAKDVNSCSCGGDCEELLAIGGMVCKKRTQRLHKISSRNVHKHQRHKLVEPKYYLIRG